MNGKALQKYFKGVFPSEGNHRNPELGMCLKSSRSKDKYGRNGVRRTALGIQPSHQGWVAPGSAGPGRALDEWKGKILEGLEESDVTY